MAQTPSLIPALTLLLGLNAAPAAQAQSASSPQEKIVEKLGLQERLKSSRWEDVQENNSGCHQPSAKGKEKKTYDIFRQVVKNARGLDATLLMVCQATLGMGPDAVHAHSRTDSAMVKVTESFTHLPPKQQKAILAHELTHIYNEDRIMHPMQLPEIQRFHQFEKQVLEAAQRRRRSGNPLTPQELSGLAAMEQVLLKEAVAAETRLIRENHQHEKDADAGGVILAAGKGCKTDTESLALGLEAIVKTLQINPALASVTHPAFRERKTYLEENAGAIKDMCREVYRPVKNQKPDKRPPSRGR